MAKIEHATVDERIRNGYEFEFGNYISEGFEIFSKEWVMFCLYSISAFLLLVFSAFTVVGFIFIFYPTLLGFSVAADKVSRGEKLQFKDFFGAFNNLGQHAVLGIVFVLLYALFLGPYFFIVYSNFGQTNPDLIFNSMALGMVLMLVFGVLMYVGITLMIYSPYLVHFGNYSAVEAIKKSFGLAKRNFWWLILFTFVVGLIINMGQYACLIGMIPSFAIGMLIQHALVKNVLFTEDYTEIDEIGKIGN